MKKLLSSLLVAGLLATSCQPTANVDSLTDAPVIRECAAHDVLQQQIQVDPDRLARLESFDRQVEAYIQGHKNYKMSGDTLKIPVWVNVLYRTAAENISIAQIQSQIDVLNEDYSGRNADGSLTPAGFQAVKSGDIKIRFVWSSTAVTRKSTTKTSWKTNDDMKKSARGGIDPTACSTTLNLWVCNLGTSLLGYAQFPGGTCATDGVVIHTQAFGRGSGFTLYAAYNKGRTATHEVGHYFNLRHIWGDATCGNDQVSDTPLHNTANYNCPVYPTKSTCTGTPVMMTMNYMDYTADACMYMFTAGQRDRMQATYALGGVRSTLR